MIRRATVLIAGLILVAAAAPATAETLEAVVGKHIEARGGTDAWKAVETLEVTGTYTAFSQVGPFTMRRARDRRVRLDCHWNEHPVSIGYDGEDAWQINPMFQIAWAQHIRGLDRQVLMLDVDFATPLFDYQDRGYEAELLGAGDVEGQEVIQVKLTRPDGFDETWSLDPETYLEVARDSPGSDFGRPERQRTYFDDFRQVGDLKVPFYVESQWYTRTRVMEADEVTVNVEVDDGVFSVPPPPGMDKLLPMVGEWHVKLEQRPNPGAPWSENERTVTVEPAMGGALLREGLTTSQGVRVENTLTYDQFRGRYVMTSMNDFTSHMDIQEGNFDEETARLTLSNATTGTSWTGFGRTFHERNSYFDITADGFKMEQETSIDGGENWFLNAKMTYTKKTEESDSDAPAGAGED
ncbi:MAG: DUF1579 domain-containing protein [bacterium]|nr:DUF1579 domain-containing protein [bacterium]